MGGSDSKVQQVAQHRNYKIDKKLGSGGFGDVYLAKTTSGRKVAMKICRTAKSAFNEAKTLKDLSSPYIVEMDDFYMLKIHSETFFALVLEFCELGDLEKYLSKCNPSKEQRIVWCFELASGLEYIHGKGIAHRDIKPQNILVTIRGHVKLGDVGLAKAAYDLGVNINPSISATSFEEYYMNEYAGTRPYMAPEVYNRHYQKHSDVFSLGLVFFVMAERPKPLLPLTSNQRQQQYLGKLLQENIYARSRSPTSLLSVPCKNATNSEICLYDSMLQFEYRSRPKASEVVSELRNMTDDPGDIPDPHEMFDVVVQKESWLTWRNAVLVAGAVALVLLVAA
jgi:serine/threonine protein kinase